MKYDAIVIGAGHAGAEAALALARLGNETLLVTLDINSVSHMACNPNIGGTGKGHLVREIDALGGQMGLNADSSLLQIKMLNRGKGAAVQSLRGQTDKEVYHSNMLGAIEAQPHITLLEGDVEKLIVKGGEIKGVIISGKEHYAGAVVICCGVYLLSMTITGEEIQNSGPYGFKRADYLSRSLIEEGLPLRRFKTGTPARVFSDSIDYSVMEREDGDDDISCFSFLTKEKLVEQVPCYLTYTNEVTHQIIRDNIAKAPLFNGSIHGVGPRYCPSIEDKIMRFADKTRHQVFIEPESADSPLKYVQGMSSSMPKDVQEAMYRSIRGVERVKFARYAYAIEYDCLDPLSLMPDLQTKNIKGLFAAGQINGSSGYEEAGAQGIMAGINADRYLKGKSPVIIGRSEGYIGVLIDDLVTKGTNEPYRMMTARAEYRLSLRQDNADSRLTPLGREIGLVDDDRWQSFNNRQGLKGLITEALTKTLSPKVASPIMEAKGESPLKSGIKIEDMLKRATMEAADIIDFLPENIRAIELVKEVATEIKYRGYLEKEKSMQKDAEQLESKVLPENIDYKGMSNLRIEARQKLAAVHPRTLGQASRISGVSPADINVLITYLMRKE